MDDEKPIISVPDDSIPQPLPDQQRIENIYGILIRVTTAPTWIPRSFYEGFAVDTTNNRFYFYDFTNNAWQYASAGVATPVSIANGGTGQTTAAAALNAFLPSQTGNSGEFLTTDGSAASWTSVNDEIFGNGADGNVTISVDTTLSSDMYYDTLTINSGKVLTTAGYRIYCKTALVNNGTISWNGNNGTAGGNASGRTGGTAGTGGAALASTNIYGGVAGVGGGAGGNGKRYSVDGAVAGDAGAAGSNGNSVTSAVGNTGEVGRTGGSGRNGSGGGGAGGVAGARTLSKVQPNQVNIALQFHEIIGTGVNYLTCSGGSGGSGGGGGGGIVNVGAGNPDSGAGGGGGGSGSNGGNIIIAAKAMSGSGTITANGGNGGNGGNGSDCVPDGVKLAGGGGGGAGGTGGAGGCVILIYKTKTGNTVSVTPGSGGTGGTGGATYDPPDNFPGLTGEDGLTGPPGKQFLFAI